MKKSFLIASVILFTAQLFSQTFEDLDKMESYKGFFNFYYDEEKDRIYMEVAELDQDFLYVHALSSGLGHNDIGLDRGQLGGQAVVHFRRAGERLLLVQPNLRYRAKSENQLERLAVEQAFAKSVLYGFELLDSKEGRFLIDISEMLFHDTHGVADRLESAGQGNYRLDQKRSAISLERTRAFPDNVEFDAMVTFTGKPTSGLIRSVTPDPRHVTVVQHHSFVRLPDADYKPRTFHPQSGCISRSHMDFATPVFEPIQKRVIVRHRLQKKDPAAPVSEPVEPIIYYLDNGTPEPMRSALLEGGEWWAEAFEEIGFKNAFRVEILPDHADPLDIRYNVIQWVHRSTRGWSYGSSVTDPRTGEIIKGHVSLGSLRIRQDFKIAQALVENPYATSDENHQAMMDLALARIRQLSAHEIGHTLGFTHNFAASSNGRSSVMDYPHPLVYVEDRKIKLDKAYEEGIADWDKVTVAYAYTEFEGEEEKQLAEILREANRKGLRFISDSDARSPGGAHPYAHLWDNGSSAVEELENVLQVRAIAIENFSLDNIPNGEPFTILEDLFVPLYFFHRYQVEAASKLIAGVDYQYSVKGDPIQKPVMVEPTLQRVTLKKLIHTLSPEVVQIPESKLDLFPPRAYGYFPTRESFSGQTGITFDCLAPPATAAHMTLGFLLHPQRANRLIQQKALDKNQLGLEELLSELIKETFYKISKESGYTAEVLHSVNFLVLEHLINLGSHKQSKPQVRAIVKSQLAQLNSWLEKQKLSGPALAYQKAYMNQIRENRVTLLQYIPEIPPGAPIGMDCMEIKQNRPSDSY